MDEQPVLLVGRSNDASLAILFSGEIRKITNKTCEIVKYLSDEHDPVELDINNVGKKYNTEWDYATQKESLGIQAKARIFDIDFDIFAD